MRFLERGQQPPLPPSVRGSGERCELPAAFRAEPRPHKGFLLFSALRTASLDIIIFLIVDSHAAIGCKTPMLPAYNIHGCRPVLHISFSMEQAKCPILA